jgi:hypothetical protein
MAVISELDNNTLGDLFETEKSLTANPNGMTACAASTYFRSHANEMHQSAHSEFHSEILHSHELVIGLNRAQFVATIDMLRKDVADAQFSLTGSISLFMAIISQGLAALAAFLIAINAINFSYGQCAVIITMYAAAAIWTLLLGKLTASSRTYGIVVLADSVRFLNTALGLKDSVDERGPSCRCFCSHTEVFDRDKEDTWFNAYNIARSRTLGVNNIASKLGKHSDVYNDV